MPGQAKIVSVTSAPETRPGSDKAMIVTTGINAFFKPWPKITRSGARPLAAAVRM